MSISREFLGWHEASLPEAARRLSSRYRQGRVLDLGPVIVVLPGQRAGRRLKELLAFLAEDEKLRLTPPEVTTEGRLPEMLYTPKLPFSGDIVQDLAWAQALRDLPAQQRRHVVPYPPAADDAMRWLELARMLRNLHRELSADGLDFTAVVKNGPKIADFTETARWQALSALQQRYLSILDGQQLWDIQTARLKAIEFREIHTECDIILLGTVDLNETLRQMLDLVADRVTAYIAAPEDRADDFDGHGCLVPAAWSAARIPLRDDQLRQVDGPVEQADSVTCWLRDLAGRYRNDEVVVGVADESLVPQLQRQLEQFGVHGRWVEGTRLGDTGPYRLLASAVRFAERRRYDDFAALLRHPDMEDWLTGESASSRPSLPAQLDRYYNGRFPSRIRSGQRIEGHEDWPDLATALKCVDTWLSDASARRPLRLWGDVFRKILGAVYGARTLDLEVPADLVLHRTVRQMLDECDRLRLLPEGLDVYPVSAVDAFQVAIGPLAGESLPPPADPDAIEILGWLELPLDDSQALIVTSFNEGNVPKSVGADAFLPDRLRRELGLLHNERRYARDAYATTVLCQSRKNLQVVFARRDAKDDPLQPSRILFACPDQELIRRAMLFFGEHKPTTPARSFLLAADQVIPAESQFKVPPPDGGDHGLRQISVTQFKHYIACPYRYYLRYVKKLKAVDDSARELEASTFGQLLHEALSALGHDPGAPRNSTSERDLFDFLDAQVQAIARTKIGREGLRPAIQLQIEQARRRLQAFATRQVALVREGWQIVYCENPQVDEDLKAKFAVDEQDITLVGRIDRIDFHEANRTVRIVDYKTGDTGQKPDEAHRKAEQWVDLQLPLYRHLWHDAGLQLPAECNIELGYFNLPKDPAQTDFCNAPWDDAMLDAADEKAREVIRNLRKGVFEPRTNPAPPHTEDLAAICLDNTISGPVLRDEYDFTPENAENDPC
jgi:RecB family exonuclease